MTQASIGNGISESVADKLMAEVRRALDPDKPALDKTFKDVDIDRGGSTIVLPDGMSYGDARNWMTKKEEAEEKLISVGHELKCFPLDGVRALTQALTRIFGFTEWRSTPGFFGPNPPHLHTIRTSIDTVESVVIGRIAPLGLEGGHFDVMIPSDGEPRVLIGGRMKAKFKNAMEIIFQFTEHVLRTESIYRGKAVVLDLSYLDVGEFDMDSCAPQYMDIRKIKPNDLILSSDVRFDLESNIWSLIEATEACRANGVPLRHGALLAGAYGTGKTLTAQVTAHKAQTNNWTFLYLKQSEHLAYALRLAELYSPAVLFVEDVDKVTTGGRSNDINTLLNTLDGVDTKGKEIITIMTSNHPERINPAFMRAGRIDTFIKMTNPDAGAAQQFVEVYAKNTNGKSLLSKDVDMTTVGESLADLPAAFISEAVQKAKRATILREKVADITGKIETQDLVSAASVVRAHAEMAKLEAPPTDEQRVAIATREIYEYGRFGAVRSTQSASVAEN